MTVRIRDFVNYSCPPAPGDWRKGRLVSPLHRKGRQALPADAKASFRRWRLPARIRLDAPVLDRKKITQANRKERQNPRSEIHDGYDHTLAVIPRKNALPTLNNYRIDGLRTDPFNCFPIKATYYTKFAMDWLTQVYAPTWGRAILGNENPFKDKLFPWAMEQDLVFEGLVALGLSETLRGRNLDSRRGQAMFHHRGNVLRKLREKLERSQIDDSAINATIALLRIEFMLGDRKGVKAHLLGMNKMIELKGGLESLGLGGYTALQAKFLDTMCREFLQGEEDLGEAQHSRKTVLKYPQHPFSTSLCRILAEIPSGFCEIAVAGALSLQFIDVIGLYQQWIRGGQKCDNALFGHMIQNSMMLMTIPPYDVSPLQRCIRLALIAFRSDTSTCKMLLYLFILTPDLVHNVFPRHELGPAVIRCLVWIATVLAGAHDLERTISEKSLYVRQCLLREMLDGYTTRTQLVPNRWTEMEKLLRSFFWNDQLSKTWRQVWAGLIDDET